MITINATMSQIIKIGHQGENKAVQVAFDLTPFQSAFPGGHPQLVVRRPGDHSGYPVALIVDGSQAIWIVSASDTEKSGRGQCEMQWFVGDTLAKSDKYNFLIYSSIPGDAEPPDVPSKAWFEKILSDIGDLSYLDTEAKENLVAAINEARQTGGGGAGGTNDHTKLSNRDAADQHPIGAITGLEAALAGKQPAGSYLTVESDPTVPAWAKEAQKPSYTAQEVGADPSGMAAGLVAAHNTAEAAHNDIRLLISGLTDRLNALADSDDTTLDQLSEVVAYIKANRELIASITTDKVSVTDIVNDLVTNVTNKPLSAAQGVALKALIDAITIPDKLPNPNALTFTGAATGSYDGSKPLTVDVPSVTVDSSLTVEGQAADAKAVGDAISRISDDIAGVSSGGISVTARNLLITILRNGVYSSDQSSNITDLENALGGSETVFYTITNNLTNVTNSNSAGSIQEKTAYIASLTAVDGYTLDSVTVTMGGLDVTADVYADGVINISSVTGDVEIVASAIAASTEPVLNTNGLVFDYDFRTASMESYNLSGWGNVYKTVDKTGTGLLFGTAESTGDGVGLADYHFREHRLVSSETQKITLGSSYTAQFLYRSQTLGGTRAQPNMFNWGYNTNALTNIRLKPIYLVGTTETTITDNVDAPITVADYAVITYVVDGTKLTVYYNDSVIYNFDGSNYDGFTKWMDYGVPNTMYNKGYAVSFVGYNRALSEVEIVDNLEYFKTLEVTA